MTALDLIKALNRSDNVRTHSILYIETKFGGMDLVGDHRSELMFRLKVESTFKDQKHPFDFFSHKSVIDYGDLAKIYKIASFPRLS